MCLAENAYPNSETIQTLSAQLGVGEVPIRRWFASERRKIRVGKSKASVSKSK